MKIGDHITLKYDPAFRGIITATIDTGGVTLYQTSYSNSGVPTTANLNICEIELVKNDKFGFKK